MSPSLKGRLLNTDAAFISGLEPSLAPVERRFQNSINSIWPEMKGSKQASFMEIKKLRVSKFNFRV